MQTNKSQTNKGLKITKPIHLKANRQENRMSTSFTSYKISITKEKLLHCFLLEFIIILCTLSLAVSAYYLIILVFS